MDTVALNWSRQGGTELLARLSEHQATMPFARGRLLLDKSRSGLRVMAWPDYGVVKAECRLSALLDRDAQSFRLASRAELLWADRAMRAELLELLGVEPSGQTAAVSRYDLTTERAFEDGAEGQAVLKAFRALRPAGYCVVPWVQCDGAVREVSIRTGKSGRKVFRAYDKGIESGSHPAGQRIRFEAQNRPRPAKRRTPAELVGADLRHDFGRTIEPFLRGDSVTVTDPSGVVDVLASRVADGGISLARAERLAGAEMFLRRFGRGFYADDKKSERRLRALRQAGIAVDDELPPGARVPVSELLAELVREFETA